METLVSDILLQSFHPNLGQNYDDMFPQSLTATLMSLNEMELSRCTVIDEVIKSLNPPVAAKLTLLRTILMSRAELS